MEIHLKIIGCLLIVLASIHIFFPKYFNWKEELKPLSLINKQMMTVHTFFIAFVVLLIGLLCLTSETDLTQTKLGKTVSLGLGIFWATRLIFQLFVYSPKLWKGKKFETTIHVIFTILWSYLTSIFLWIGLS
jgi:C4-dicarboxylate transporter